MAVVLFGALLVLATPASAVKAYEWNTARSSSAGGGPMCATLYIDGHTRADACFAANGDKIYIEDRYGDGRSATAVWENYHGNTLYRHGACVNKLSSGHVGVCDKNMAEGSTIYLYACNYETSNNTWHGCGSRVKFRV